MDYRGQKYICGTPDLQKPMTVKLLKKDLNWKLVLLPELYLGEEYFKGNIEIKNGTIYDFLWDHLCAARALCSPIVRLARAPFGLLCLAGRPAPEAARVIF